MHGVSFSKQYIKLILSELVSTLKHDDTGIKETEGEDEGERRDMVFLPALQSFT